MVLPLMSFSGRDFFTNIRTQMDSNKGMVTGNDSGLQFVVLDAALYRLEIFRRPIRQKFTDSATTLGPDIRILINGQFFGESKFDYRQCLDHPCELRWEGEIIIAGNRLVGLCNSIPCKPTFRFIGRENAIPIWRYHIGVGDPSGFAPSLNHAMGALLPLIEGRRPFYRTPAAAENKWLRSDADKGKAGIGIHRASGCLLIFSQQHNAKPGIGFIDLSDRMIEMGIDDAVACDGSDSATLIVDGTVHANPADYKDNGIPTALMFRLAPIVFQSSNSILNITSSSDPQFKFPQFRHSKLDNVEGIIKAIGGLELTLDSLGETPDNDRLDIASRMEISLPVSLYSTNTNLHNGVTFKTPQFLLTGINITNLKLSRAAGGWDQLVGSIKVINSRGEINGDLIINI